MADPVAAATVPPSLRVRVLLTALLAAAAGIAGPAAATGPIEVDHATADTLSAPPGGAPVPGVVAVDAPSPTQPLLGAVRADRLSHASLGLAIGVGVGLPTREPATGAAAVVALAVAKELLDDRFDRGDLAAGAAGAALAWLIVAALTR